LGPWGTSNLSILQNHFIAFAVVTGNGGDDAISPTALYVGGSNTHFDPKLQTNGIANTNLDAYGCLPPARHTHEYVLTIVSHCSLCRNWGYRRERQLDSPPNGARLSRHCNEHHRCDNITRHIIRRSLLLGRPHHSYLLYPPLLRSLRNVLHVRCFGCQHPWVRVHDDNR